MKQDILINTNSAETRVAILEDGRVEEVYVERQSNLGLVGNIYLGKVVRVLPGMQSAFIEIGLERTAFLHVADMVVAAHSPSASQVSTGNTLPPIETILFDGQTVLVQVIKDPIGTKGARLSTKISIAGRLLVHLPKEQGIGVTQKVEDDEERWALKNRLIDLLGTNKNNAQGGYIIRTAACDSPIDEWQNDINYLNCAWKNIQQLAQKHPAPYLIHKDLSLAQRVLRDMVTTDTASVVTDDAQTLAELQEFAEQYTPSVTGKLMLAPIERPLFDAYKVEEEINLALQLRVDLKSGGYLVIEATEAMTTIDVNTGSYVSGRNFADTILKTNLEAAREIVHQLRLRNLGGMIILDFIDMSNPTHAESVMDTLRKEFARDRTRTAVYPFSPLGLIEVTRKRTRESLAQLLCEPCPMCSGRGVIKTTRTICYEILREIRREACQFNATAFRVVAHPDVVDMLLDEVAPHLAAVSSQIAKPISLQTQNMFFQEQYDIILM
ncbi:Rne/Rng family ribonuclease [Hydromonas duriensis]|uniref:Ribonuclease G n=1 Tax=Hydromonas duriensis TaxID=1527608 RepID=A0A4R6YAY2_9BURK|nr:Rne/Rng family ribonuclease [Hydromonas duriensis]TDR32708.1 RNAse G [Hydromonas duriensis]